MRETNSKRKVSQLSERYVVGVDLGGTKVYTALAARDGKVLAETKIPTGAEHGLQHVVDRMIESVEHVVEAARASKGGLGALALGAPGPLDSNSGIIHQAPNLKWRNVPIKQILEQRLSIPVLLDNDANLAALGEYTYGAGQGEVNMVYITVSTGVGGAIIIDGRLFRGSSDGAGEIGHMTLLPDGPLCGCGNRGCLEALASGTAMAREARELVKRGGGKRIIEEAGGEPGKIDSATIATAARAGDLEACAIISKAAGYLGIGVANVLNLLNPSLVVMGGGVMEIGGPIWEGIRKEVQSRALEAARAGSKIVPAKLGGRAGVMGAVALALKSNR